MVNAAPAVEIISCSVNLFHSGVHHTVTIKIVSVVVIRDPFRCSTCAVRFQPVPFAFQLQPAGLNRTILINPVSLISQLNPAGLAGMIDRSVILRYVGFPFYGKEACFDIHHPSSGNNTRFLRCSGNRFYKCRPSSGSNTDCC